MDLLWFLYFVLGNIIWVPFAYDRWGVSSGALVRYVLLGEVFLGVGSAFLAFMTSLAISTSRRRARAPQQQPEMVAPASALASDPEMDWKNLVFSVSRVVGTVILGLITVLGLAIAYLTGLWLSAILGVATSSLFAYPLVMVLPRALRDAAITVPQQEVWIVFRLGKFVGVRRPGPGLIFPWLDRVVKRQDMRWKTMDIVANKTPTKDKISVDVPGNLRWITDNEHPEWSFLHVQDLETSLSSTAAVALRQIASTSTIEELLEAADPTVRRLNQIMMDLIKTWGVRFLLTISDTILSPELEEAISAEKRATYQASAKKTLAEAEAAAKRIRADADGYVMKQLRAAVETNFPGASEEWYGEAALQLKALDTIQATGQAGGAITVLPFGDLLSRKMPAFKPSQGEAAPKEGGET